MTSPMVAKVAPYCSAEMRRSIQYPCRMYRRAHPIPKQTAAVAAKAVSVIGVEPWLIPSANSAMNPAANRQPVQNRTFPKRWAIPGICPDAMVNTIARRRARHARDAIGG